MFIIVDNRVQIDSVILVVAQHEATMILKLFDKGVKVFLKVIAPDNFSGELAHIQVLGFAEYNIAFRLGKRKQSWLLEGDVDPAIGQLLRQSFQIGILRGNMLDIEEEYLLDELAVALRIAQSR